MKIDLTPRDIEMLLMLLNEEVSDKLDLDGPDTVSVEELSLIDKLETALKTFETGREQEFLDIKSDSVFH